MGESSKTKKEVKMSKKDEKSVNNLQINWQSFRSGKISKKSKQSRLASDDKKNLSLALRTTKVWEVPKISWDSLFF